MGEQSRPSELTLDQIATAVGGRVVGDGSVVIRGVNTLEAAGPDQISFMQDAVDPERLTGCRAGAVIVGAAAGMEASERVASGAEGADRSFLVVENVEAALIGVQALFAPRGTPPPGVHATAVVGATARLGEGVSVGPHVTIGPEAVIGDGVVLGAGCSIGQGSRVGDGTRLDANVVVYPGCVIGRGCVIQANTTIGSTGFGYYPVEGRPRLIPHNGGVIIEDEVEIGANCCVDRAKFGDTVIGAGTKIDNQVQIAHNVRIGRCCLIAAHVGIAGSCTLGDGVVLGGKVGLADHVTVGDGAMLGAYAAVSSDVPAGARMLGIPAMDIAQCRRVFAVYCRLPQWVSRIKALEKEVGRRRSGDGPAGSGAAGAEPKAEG